MKDERLQTKKWTATEMLHLFDTAKMKAGESHAGQIFDTADGMGLRLKF